MKYLNYIIENVQPMRLGNSDNMNKNQMGTLSYIPGTSIRGYVLNWISNNQSEKFKAIKPELMSDKVSFLNGNLLYDENICMISPKGFYEDKTDNMEIKNILFSGQVKEGWKRANLGKFTFFKENRVCYVSPRINENTRIDVKKEDVFRSRHLGEHHKFQLSVRLNSVSEETEQIIKQAFESEEIYLGGSRTSGFGKCRISFAGESKEHAFLKMSVTQNNTTKDNILYMLLLSDLSMRNQFGEIVGIDEGTLKKELGVDFIEILGAVTSTKDISGINRIWGCKTAIIPMYEAGSVIKIKLNTEPNMGKLREIEDKGLGVRREEGYGRVLFINDINKYQLKESIEWENETKDKEINLTKEDKSVLKNIVKRSYIIEIENAINKYIVNPKLKLSGNKSQKGSIYNICKVMKYQPEKGMEYLKQYIEHGKKKIEESKKHSTYSVKNNLLEQIESFLEISLSVLLKEELPKHDWEYSLESVLGSVEINYYKLLFLEKYLNVLLRGEE